MQINFVIVPARFSKELYSRVECLITVSNKNLEKWFK